MQTLRGLDIYKGVNELGQSIQGNETGFTGVRPSSGGSLHFGHYKGFLSNLRELQRVLPERLFIVIADRQALSDVPTREGVQAVQEGTIRSTIDVLSTLDTLDGVSVFRESSVTRGLGHLKEILETYCMLDDIYSPNNFHYTSLDDQIAKNTRKGKQNVISLVFYQIGQACQILGALQEKGRVVVPSGPDQFDPINLGNKITARLHDKFGINLGKAVSISDEIEVLGVNGKKMGKSEGNAININDCNATIKEKVSQINTRVAIQSFIGNFGTDEEVETLARSMHLTSKQYSNYHKRITELLCTISQPIAEKYKMYQSDTDLVKRILDEGDAKYLENVNAVIDRVTYGIYG